MDNAQAFSSAVAEFNNSASVAVNGSLNRKAVKEARAARQWAREERELQNQWNLEQWNRQNEWNLEQWNRQNAKQEEWRDYDNEYNSPLAQRERMEAAGYSPLAAIPNGGESSMSAPVGLQADELSSANVGSPSLPNLQNPYQSYQPFAAEQNYLAFQQQKVLEGKLNLEQQKTQAELGKIQAETAKTWSDQKSVEAFRDGQVKFLGIQCDMGESTKNLTDTQIKVALQNIRESEQRIQQSIQWVRESNARLSFTEWQQEAARAKLPKELILLGSQAILMSEQADDIRLSKHYKANLIEQKFLGQSQENSRNRLKFLQEQWYNDNLFEDVETRKLDKLESEIHLNYSTMTAAHLQQFNNAWRNFTVRQVGKSYTKRSNFRPFERSTVNSF